MGKIYTRKGDRGQTSLVGGQRVSKCCDRLESYGTIDELNSHIGVLITLCSDHHDVEFLTNIQSTLFVVGGYLATDNTTPKEHPETIVTEEMVSAVEAEIDRLETIVPPLRLFVLPGGCREAAYAHVCRTVCRRAERCMFRLVECGIEVDERITSYVNRLSDYFFLLARKLNIDAGKGDVTWKSH
ncbi:MAG: cob(I)yrinic acid a,c-diamide adenosyltransferase [Bacteroidaceae bacterium]|jgi:cob(I)alamin adenosyltransferase|nr:cob(I)yrinic acid a,c-diamide adenosyltransferase [Bacteroidaceae bacterium]